MLNIQIHMLINNESFIKLYLTNRTQLLDFIRPNSPQAKSPSFNMYSISISIYFWIVHVRHEV